MTLQEKVESLRKEWHSCFNESEDVKKRIDEILPNLDHMHNAETKPLRQEEIRLVERCAEISNELKELGFEVKFQIGDLDKYK